MFKNRVDSNSLLAKREYSLFGENGKMSHKATEPSIRIESMLSNNGIILAIILLRVSVD
jgi:hypothetical protein